MTLQVGYMRAFYEAHQRKTFPGNGESDDGDSNLTYGADYASYPR